MDQVDHRLNASDEMAVDAYVEEVVNDDDEVACPCRNYRPSSAKNACVLVDDLEVVPYVDPCDAFSRNLEVVDDEEVVALDPKRDSVVVDLWMNVVDHLDVERAFHSDPSNDVEASFCTYVDEAEVDYQDDED